MKEIKGDYWQEAKKGYTHIVCTTNMINSRYGPLIMGAGIAKDFKLLFKGIDKVWGQKLLAIKKETREFYPSHLLFSPANQFINDEWCKDITLVGLPTKYDWVEPSSLTLIRLSCIKLREELPNNAKCLMTRLGCGNGKLNWMEVRKEIEKILDDRFVIINYT